MTPKQRWHLIRDSLRIEEALDGLGITAKRRMGDEIWASCPLPSHGGADRNPSFSVNIAKRAYNCFSCGAGGGIVSLVKELQGCDMDAAVTFLTEYSDGIPEDDHELWLKSVMSLLDRTGPPKPPPLPALPYFPPSMAEGWHARAHEIADWFAYRQVSEAVDPLMLGYAPEHRRDEYIGPAAMIPAFFEGRLVGYQARWLEWEKDWDGPPKYVASTDFPKRQILYNYDNAITHSGPVYVVESAMTAARLVAYGVMSVATIGASISDYQLRLLRRFRHLVVSFDNDDAGRGALDRVESLDRAVNLDWLPAPEGKKADLGDLSDEELATHLPRAMPYVMRAFG